MAIFTFACVQTHKLESTQTHTHYDRTHSYETHLSHLKLIGKG